ncbi:MAG TPA: hypothetical protein VNO33_22240 [Kofleriaceae bacterium]|nr:hypothetical protein [Kofleriaceae bacterium]
MAPLPLHTSSAPGAPEAATLADPTTADVSADPTADPSPAGELGSSSARVTVGEGDDRVALWIAIRGESVRVDARAQSAAYADVLHQRADELASGLADRGLVLGSLSADVSGDQTPRSRDRDPDAQPRPHHHADPDPPTDTDQRPTQPRPRGLRAIA